MSRRLTRKQMKHDEVGEALSKTMSFLTGHLRLVGIVAAALVLVFVLGTVIDRLLGGRREGASDDLAEAIQILGAPLVGELPEGSTLDLPVFDSAEQRRAEARKILEDLAGRRSKTGRIAQSYLASLAFEEGDLETARQTWRQLAAGDDSALAVQAELNLITLDRGAGNAEAVEARLTAQLDKAGVLPPDAVLYELAVTQEQLGKTAESLATYGRLLEEHPQSAYGPEARRKTASAATGA